MGVTRGWYIWRSFDPQTWEAEVSHDRPQDSGTPEVWKVRVLPWATTYRYLVYGTRPDQLLPGERVNLFFNPDEHHRRGYLVHFQDEICQMKGHGHSWQVRQVTDSGFTARAVAGDKPLEEQDRAFVLDPECRIWSKGQLVKKATLAENDHIYLTWCARDGKQIVRLLSDEASLEAIKQREADRLAEEIAAEGIAGRLDSIDGQQTHFMVFAEHWFQSQQFKEGTRVRVTGTGKGFHPQGPTVEATVTFRGRCSADANVSGVARAAVDSRESMTAGASIAVAFWVARPRAPAMGVVDGRLATPIAGALGRATHQFSRHSLILIRELTDSRSRARGRDCG